MEAAKPFATESWKDITFTTPNLNELRTMNKFLKKREDITSDFEHELNDLNETTTVDARPLEDILKECVELCRPLIEHISTIIVTLGKHGVLVCRDVPFDSPFTEDGKFIGVGKRKYNGLVSAVHFPAYGNENQQVEVVSVTGAGDRYVMATLRGVGCLSRKIHRVVGKGQLKLIES